MAEVVARLLEFLAGRTRTARLRLQLSHHTSLLSELPDGGSAHEQLSAYIDQLVSELIRREKEAAARKRDGGTIAASVFLVALFGLPSWFAWNAGGWWWAALIPFVPLLAASIGTLAGAIRGNVPDDGEHQ